MILRHRELKLKCGRGRVLSECDFVTGCADAIPLIVNLGRVIWPAGPTPSITDMGMEEEARFCVVAALSLV
jgi:ribosomal protein L1